MTETMPELLSQSVQMYLVSIARLRVDDQPVPLSQLAQELSVSPVSVNEMCRRLQDQGLVIYRPYKGASFTPEGERRAHYILRRHRLWEVFLVERLGLSYDEAHEAACRLEHSTPRLVADRLEAFLGHPSVNPKGDPIPRADGALSERFVVPLATLTAGQHGHVIKCDGGDADKTFLEEQGLRPGTMLVVLAATEEGLLVQVEGTHISLARSLAAAVQVELKEASDQASETLTESGLEKEKPAGPRMTQMPLHKLSVGQRGVVVRVGGKGPARRRMMDMGLVPGTEVNVVRVAPLGDPIEFRIRGYSLSLRKSEAAQITIEVPLEEDE